MPPSPFSLHRRRIIVCAFAASLGVIACAAGIVLIGKSGSSSVGARDVDQMPAGPTMSGVAARRERSLRDRSQSARSARRSSRRRYAALGGRAALALARRAFPEQLRAPLFSGKGAGGMRVIAGRGRGRSLVTDRAGRKLLLVASHPLEAKTADGKLAPVDLSLKQSPAGMGPVNSRAPFVVDPSSAARVSFTGRGIGMRVAAARSIAGARRVPARIRAAQLSDGRVFFANVQTDTDAAVSALPNGSELFLVARSERAPQLFSAALDLPAGATLRRAVSDTPLPAGVPRSIEIVKNKQTLGYVSAPIASDGDGRRVPVSISIDGQSIVLAVPHRGRDIRYPVSIDPEFVLWSDHYNGGRFAGWMWGQTPGNGQWFGAIDDCAVYCGLYQALLPNRAAANGSSARFAYQAPPKSAITQATFGGVAHAPYTYAGVPWTRAQQGILRTTGWERGRFANQAGVQPDTGYAASVSTSASFWGQENIVAVDQSQQPAQQSNWAVMAMNAYHPYGGVVGPTSSYGATTMAWGRIVIADNYPPAWHPATPAPSDSDWTDDSGSAHSRSFRATDEGLGLYKLKLTGAKSISAPPAAEGTVAGDTITAKCAGISPQPVCPTDWPATPVNYTLNEGVNTLTAQASDVVGAATPSRTWTEKIDRTPPAITGVSGSLKDVDRGVSRASSFALRVSAADGAAGALSSQRSGVKYIEIRINDDAGERVKRAPAQSCSAGSCAMTEDFSISEQDLGEDGAKTVSIVAVDQLGHASDATSNAITFTLDRVAPVVYDDGSVFGAAGRPLTEDEYTIGGSALDLTELNEAGSGIQRLEVWVKGVKVASENVGGCTPARCPQSGALASSYTLRTAEVGDGEHEVELRAIDLAGNMGSETGEANVMRAESLPPTALTTPADEDWRVEGGSPGDQAGSSVASVGDVNDDGIEDMLVGAPGADPLGRSNAGAAYIVLGGNTDAPVSLRQGADRVVQLAGARSGDRAGTSVAAAGDVNGDGIADLLIGSPGSMPNLIRQGNVYVVFGGPALGDVDLGALGSGGLTIRGPAITIDPELSDTGTTFGEQVGTRRLGDFAVEGDVNGDDLDDIIIGAANQGDLLALRPFGGVAYVVFGQARGGLIEAADLQANGYRINGAAASHGAGQSTTFVGDVNGDDLADVALTAPRANAAGRSSSGSAYVIFGKSSTTPVDLANVGEQGYTIHGASGDRITNVASAGDVDGDSNPDVLLGGRGGTLLFAKADSATVDLAGPIDGYRMAPPPDAGSEPAVVAGLADLDEDDGPDTFIGFPSAAGDAGAGYAVFGQSSARDLDLANLPGEHGTRLNGGTSARSASAADSLDAGVDEDTTLLSAEPSSGPGGAVRAIAKRKIKPRFNLTKDGCQKRSLWSLPFKGDPKHAVPRCRRATKGTVDTPAKSFDDVRANFNPNPRLRCESLRPVLRSISLRRLYSRAASSTIAGIVSPADA